MSAGMISMVDDVFARPHSDAAGFESRVATLRRLHVRHAGFVRALLVRLGAPSADADDAVQQVFLVAWRKQAVLVDDEAERSWLCAIALRVAAKARRRAAVRRFLGLEAAEELPDPRTPASEMDAADARRLVHAALDGLSERKRQVFVLFEIEGLTGDEVARAVGCPVKTVWTRLFHARREVAAWLNRERLREASRMAVPREAP